MGTITNWVFPDIVSYLSSAPTFEFLHCVLLFSITAELLSSTMITTTAAVAMI